MRASHLTILSVTDLGDKLKYQVTSEFTEDQELIVYKDGANGIPPLSADDKARYLVPSCRSLQSTTFYVGLRGGIGDTVIGLELLLQVHVLYKTAAVDCDFVIELPRSRAKLFKKLIKALPLKSKILATEDLSPDAELYFSHPVVMLEASPNPHRADQFCAADVRTFFWRKWGFGDFVPSLIDQELNCWKNEIRQTSLKDVPEKPFILLAPSGSNDRISVLKTWSLASWSRLAEKILSEFDGDLVILDDHQLYQSFQSNQRVHFIQLSNFSDDGLEILGHLLLKSKACVCIDSGPAHFAGFLGLSALVLWGPTSPMLYGHPKNHNLRLSTCPPCSASSRLQFCIDPICMSDIPENLVWESVQRKLDG